MPHIVINLYPGRSPKVKQEMAKKLLEQFAKSNGFKKGDISIGMVEIEPENFEKRIKTDYKEQEIIIESDYIKKITMSGC